MGGAFSASPLEVGATLGLEFARHSSGASYSSNFRVLRAAEESRPLSFVDVGEVESYNIPFTMSELRFALFLCRDGAAGPDGFSYPFLRHLHPTAMEFLLSFFNWVYSSELFTDLWHHPIVIPIPKLGKDHSLPGNFLPISFTSCLCELLERMGGGALGLSPRKHPRSVPLQFGFRSMADPLLRLKFAISSAFENGKFVHAVFFDLQKVYDITTFLPFLWTFTSLHPKFVG